MALSSTGWTTWLRCGASLTLCTATQPIWHWRRSTGTTGQILTVPLLSSSSSARSLRCFVYCLRLFSSTVDWTAFFSLLLDPLFGWTKPLRVALPSLHHRSPALLGRAHHARWLGAASRDCDQVTRSAARSGRRRGAQLRFLNCRAAHTLSSTPPAHYLIDEQIYYGSVHSNFPWSILTFWVISIGIYGVLLIIAVFRLIIGGFRCLMIQF